jgi:hypothetical protein
VKNNISKYDDLVSIPDLNADEEALESGGDTIFGSTVQKLGESRESMMRAPDIRVFSQMSSLHDIDYLIEQMNVQWCGPRGYAVSIRRRLYADNMNKSSVNKVYFYCTRGRNYQPNLSNWTAKDLVEQNTLKRDHSTVQRSGCSFSGYFRRFAKTPGQWDLIMTNESHNHDPVASPSALPTLRQVSRKRQSEILLRRRLLKELLSHQFMMPV